jgi:hypothetical protein
MKRKLQSNFNKSSMVTVHNPMSHKTDLLLTLTTNPEQKRNKPKKK